MINRLLDQHDHHAMITGVTLGELLPDALGELLPDALGERLRVGELLGVRLCARVCVGVRVGQNGVRGQVKSPVACVDNMKKEGRRAPLP